MRTGVMATQINEGTIDDVVGEVRQAESDGFDAYWSSQIFSHDALTALAVAGREVPRIELGTAVVPTYPRHPMAMAQQALTVNAATGGRLCLGIGLSHKIVIENMMGMSFDKPVRHLREYLSVLGPLLHGEAVGFNGDDYRVNGAVTIAGATAPSVVVAALGPQMLKVAGALADGTLTWCVGPTTLTELTIPTINAAADEAGRPSPRVIAALPVCVTDDFGGAHERAAEVFAVYGQLPSYRAMLDREGVDGPADIAIIGGSEQVLERIGQLADIGVTDFVPASFGGTADEREATRQTLIASMS